MRLGVAMRHVLDSLRKPPGSKMFKFGMTAIFQFLPRLREWPQYCAHLLQIPNLQELHPELIADVRSILVDDSAHSASPAQLVPLLLPSASVESPPTVIQEKILFVINNVSYSNMDVKIKELDLVIETSDFPTSTNPQHQCGNAEFQLKPASPSANVTVRWLSSYVVVKRVSIEPNFHPLYVQFLITLGRGALMQWVEIDTYATIQHLLNSVGGNNQYGEALGQEKAQEKQMLKNLGCWLGALTLSRDRPILHKHLSLKVSHLRAQTYWWLCRDCC